MPAPVVAIVGRPNVGKSSLLNALAGIRISIVEPTAGVTRDRVAVMLEEDGRVFELTDTGGIGIVDSQDLSDLIEAQIEAGLVRADVLVTVVDAHDGLTPLDKRVADRVRRSGLPHILVVNKVESREHEQVAAAEFHELGLGTPLWVSAKQRQGLPDLTAAIVDALPPPDEDEQDSAAEPAMIVAVVGRRNAGKSTLLNAIAGDERVIVSEVPGTTRDSVDVRFEKNDRLYVAIDTAGVQRRTRLSDSIEFYSQKRTERSIRRADVVLLLVDATVEISGLEKRIARYVEAQGKPCILVINKWDLAKRPDGSHVVTGEYEEYLRDRLPWIDHAPVVFITAKTGRNVHSLLDLAGTLWKQARKRVDTSDVNDVIQEVKEKIRPRHKDNKAPKIFYATQVDTAPPRFVLFVNEPALFNAGHMRFLEDVLRERFDFPEVPVRIEVQARDPEKARIPRTGRHKIQKSI